MMKIKYDFNMIITTNSLYDDHIIIITKYLSPLTLTETVIYRLCQNLNRTYKAYL